MKTILLILLTSALLLASPKKGDKAIDFQLNDLYNTSKLHSSTSFKSKVVLLNLWASWCSGCQKEMPLFLDLQKKFSKDDFEIVLSNIDNEKESAIAFLHDVDSQKVLTSLYDKEKTLPKAYRCPGMPSSFLINKKGVIESIYIGSLDEEAIKLLKEKILILIKE